MKPSFIPTVLAGVLVSVSAVTWADVKPATVFTDHAVLQRGMAIPVWGVADAGEKVTVKIGASQAQATTDADGKWRVDLPAMEAGGPLEMTIAGNNTITLQDILVGDVWLCSGQSNMEFSVGRSINAADEIAAADHPQIRLLNVPRRATFGQVQSDQAGKWEVCSPATVKNFSAVGYFFGRDLNKALDVPIGLIGSSWGGTPAESWTSAKALNGNELFANRVPDYDKNLANYPAAKAKYDEALKTWQEENKDKPKNEQSKKPAAPQGPDNAWAPSALYNGMIHPLVPYGLKGAIWYQGESNAGKADAYRTLLPLMIGNWREVFGQGDFTFLVVQLANFMDPSEQPMQPGAWPELREAQLLTGQNTPNVGMAVIIDIGEAKDIHPKNKQDVGKRLAMAAEKIAYGRDVVFTGPTFKEMKVADGKAVLTFDSAEGMTAKDPNNTGRPLPFAVAGEDQQFHPATATIEGNQITMSSDAVANPVAVRYAWSNNPNSALLYNAAGLPASPFRTDDWPRVTAGK